jgi:hypothetical protein
MSGIAAIIFLIFALFLYFVSAVITLDRKVAEFWIDLYRQLIPWLDAHRLGRNPCMGTRGDGANQIHTCLNAQNRIRVIPHLPACELQIRDTVAASQRCGYFCFALPVVTCVEYGR